MILDHLPTLERALTAKGFPGLSPWWAETFARFYISGRRQLVIRAGRRAGKSSSLCRVAVLEALYGDHAVPPGDVGVVAIVSVSRDEGAQRLRTVRAILDALGVAHRPIDNGIELVGRPVAFKVFAASISGVSGFTTICVIADEVSKWRDLDTGANPAKEVLASLRPTMATQRSARLFLSSSPLGHLDAHAVAFELGDTDFQRVAFAPTWLANPSVTEAETHALEPDDRIWSREYAAIPQAGALSAFDMGAVDASFALQPSGTPTRGALIIDASSGKKDGWCWGIARWYRGANERHMLHVGSFGGQPGKFWSQGAGTAIAAKAAAVAQQHHVLDVHGDQRESLMLASEFSSHGLRFHEHPWTATSKPQAVELVRSWLRDGVLALEPHEPLRRELLMFEERITSSGSFTFGARGSGKDDYVALLLTAALAHLSGQFEPLVEVINNTTHVHHRDPFGPLGDPLLDVESIHGNTSDLDRFWDRIIHNQPARK